MNKVFLYLISGLLLVSIFFSCKEIQQYSEVPEIHFTSYSAKDSVDPLGNQVLFVKLIFSVVDGDGDIGLLDSDTLPPYDSIYQYNFFSTWLSKNNSMWTVQGERNYRIPFVPVDNHKAYKAEIQIDYNHYPATFQGDSIRYEFYIIDKALNQSNIEESPAIPVNINEKSSKADYDM